MKNQPNQLFLIDGNAVFYRSFYAIQNLATSDGRMTNAVFGFVNIINKIRNQFSPQYMAICFDSKKTTLRKQKFTDYKIKRQPMPEGLIPQIPIIKQIVRAFMIPSFELDGYEADDIIATLVRQATAKDIEVIIVTDDKDMFQLIEDKVKVYSPRKEGIIGYEEVKEYLGVYPKQVVDFISLAGDTSDNIPGVAGIGKITAKNLLEQYHSLDGVYKNILSIKSEKMREKLLKDEKMARLSHELALLDYEVPFKFELEQMKIDEPDKPALYEIFQDLELKKFASEFTSDIRPENIDVQLVLSDEKSVLEPFFSKIKSKRQCSILVNQEDIEGYGSIKGLSVYTENINQIYFVPIEKINILSNIFEDSEVTKIVYDRKSLLKLMRQNKQAIKGPCFDVLLAGFLLSPSQTEQSIKDLSWKYLHRSSPSGEDLALNTKNIFDLYALLKRELDSKNLHHLFETIEMPLSEVLASIELEGVKLDLPFLELAAKHTDVKIKNLQKKLYELAGEEFNLNSPKQLAQILFEKLKLTSAKKTKTGFSTNEEVLSKLAEHHPLPKLLLEYRQVAKLKSTYIDALPKLVNPETHRIHTDFRQSGTETGRLSSRNPNLQNIPIRTEEGREIRKAFIASDKNHVLLAADYSQIELRILAHLSKDEALIDAFQAGKDIHQRTAALMFGVDENLVTKDMRYAAKRVNFGIAYGMSPFGLSQDLKVSHKEAHDFIERYFNTYPKVKIYMNHMIAECEEKGYVLTLLNRRRYIPEIKSSNGAVRQFAQRQAINTPVQGTAADLIKIAMVNIHHQMEKLSFKSKLIITVHDELVFDVVKSEESKLIALVKESMIKPLNLLVPIEVSMKTGNNWAEMNPIQ